MRGCGARHVLAVPSAVGFYGGLSPAACHMAPKWHWSISGDGALSASLRTPAQLPGAMRRCCARLQAQAAGRLWRCCQSAGAAFRRSVCVASRPRTTKG